MNFNRPEIEVKQKEAGGKSKEEEPAEIMNSYSQY